jgi:hypothetical protein
VEEISNNFPNGKLSSALSPNKKYITVMLNYKFTVLSCWVQRLAGENSKIQGT